MWFSFGLITLIGSIVLIYRARWLTKWKGSPRYLSSLPLHEYKEDTHKGRIIRARLGVVAPTGFMFRVRKERFYDRLFKAIGISVEMQVHDPRFDERVYLESDIEAVGKLLSEKPELRSAVLKIFAHADLKGLSRVAIWCNQGRIWLQYKPPGKSANLIDMHAIIRLLKEIADGLFSARIPQEGRPDQFAWRAVVLLSISTATLFLGIFGLIRQATGRTDIIDPVNLFAFCLLPTAIAISAFVAVAIAALGRTSRTHLVLLEGVFVGGVGFFLAIFALAREYNTEFDFGPMSVYELHDVRAEHVISRRRRGGTRHNYYLHVHDWRQQTIGNPMRLEISSDDYRRLKTSRDVAIVVKPGTLGFAWIEAIEAR